jgi:hypothetical protein
MGSVSSAASTNASGMADVIQFLSNSGSPLLSAGLSSSQVQSILQNASPSDVVQLSDQAMQLQEMDNLFGSPDASQTAGLFSSPSPTSSSSTLDNILASLTGSSTAATPSSSAGSASSASDSSTSSLATQMASYQSELQTEALQAMFGTDPNSGTSGTSLDVLG